MYATISIKTHVVFPEITQHFTPFPSFLEMSGYNGKDILKYERAITCTYHITVEHGVAEEKPKPAPRRPDMSSFFSQVERTDPSTSTKSGSQQNNRNALPEPEQVSATFQLLGEGITSLLHTHGPTDASDFMLQIIQENMINPPKKLEGMSDQWMTDLERIPKSKLQKDWDCPICGQRFLDDPYPLVVKLPCNDKHRFDYDCIRPWLKINTTCPLDRRDFKLKEKTPPPVVDDDEEDDDNGLYG